uniref:Uncharacterized protein n=1 Tax=Quercus lobata TaxID=97700 RepID=A0A7N2QWV5_QUELO
MYLPVPVNFIFVGFEGKGNHVLSPCYKISVDKGQHHHLPIVSNINYNFSVHAIQMGEKVTSIFEHAINVFSGRDDVSGNRTDEGALWQVDMDMMDVLFSSLVEYLQLQNAYNIFIFNPKHDVKRAKYGYQTSTDRIFIVQNKDLQTKIIQSDNVLETVLALDKIKKPFNEKLPMAKFAWTVTEDTDTERGKNVTSMP